MPNATNPVLEPMSIDSAQRKLILGIFGATLAICAILVADLTSGGRPDAPALRAAATIPAMEISVDIVRSA